MKINYRKNTFLYLLFFNLLVTDVNANEDNFEYLNCANQTLGILLTACSKIVINKDLTEIHIGDVFEIGIKHSDDSEFNILNSKNIPLVIPKAEYQKKDSWIRGDFKYIKIAKGKKIFPQNEIGDVIAIVSNNDKLGSDSSTEKASDFYVLSNTKTTFLYSLSRGVLAIGIVDRGDSGSMYLCATDTCLFGHDFKIEK